MRIGVDLGGTKIEAVVLGDDGEVVTRRRRATPAESYADTLRAVVDLVTELEKELGERASVGVATPGALSPHTGRIKNANSTQLIGERLDLDLGEALDRQVRLANDANCFALSESVDGAARGARVVFGVILGTGVGGGIVVEGRVLTGRQAIAGEWGHNPLPWPQASELPGPRCYCGRYGCIESFLSGPALARDYQECFEERLAAEEIVRRAGAGEQRADACMARFEHRLARSLAHVINILDPDVIVLGGGLSRIGRLYDRVPRLWREFVFSDYVDTPLRPPAHGDASGVRGAAWLWGL
ncbi:MAG: ROK family protein [Gammaproteobacteria bacterium]|nr:MAG: ROK family protein [Gammaproteobacteria bacterium]